MAIYNENCVTSWTRPRHEARFSRNRFALPNCAQHRPSERCVAVASSSSRPPHCEGEEGPYREAQWDINPLNYQSRNRVLEGKKSAQKGRFSRFLSSWEATLIVQFLTKRRSWRQLVPSHEFALRKNRRPSIAHPSSSSSIHRIARPPKSIIEDMTRIQRAASEPT